MHTVILLVGKEGSIVYSIAYIPMAFIMIVSTVPAEKALHRSLSVVNKIAMVHPRLQYLS